MPSVTGVDDGDGFGVKGQSATGSGVVGDGAAWAGVSASSVSGAGVSAFSETGPGVLTVSNSGPAVSAESVKGTGVIGKSGDGAGVVGEGPAWAGVVARSETGSGLSAFSDSGAGVLTTSNSGAAVSAQSVDGVGVDSRSDHGVAVKASSGDAVAVAADSQGREAVTGITPSPDHAALAGTNTALGNGTGVSGRADGRDGVGVVGECALGDDSIGVLGRSTEGRGVVGIATSYNGVEGATVDGVAVYGAVTRTERDEGGTGRGVVGVAISATGVEGQSETGTGVWGESVDGDGVHGVSSSESFSAVAGIQLNPRSTGAGIYGEHKGQGPAGFFRGNVVVTGHLEFAGADCAEEFDVAEGVHGAVVAPGTVMTLDANGALCPSRDAYDRRVAGVVAGAGDLRPGIVLGRDARATARVPVALIGRVYCCVDASFGAIQVGDLLTTSTVPGHAMKASDPQRAFGAVLGKSMRSLERGRALIPILVALQ